MMREEGVTYILFFLLRSFLEEEELEGSAIVVVVEEDEVVVVVGGRERKAGDDSGLEGSILVRVKKSLRKSSTWSLDRAGRREEEYEEGNGLLLLVQRG